MRSKTELAKDLNNCRRRVGGNFNLKEKRRNRIIRIIGIRQFNNEAGIRYNKAMEEYQYKTRQEIPSRAGYFFYNREHKERTSGYVLVCGSQGYKWFARKRDAETEMLDMLKAGN